MTYPLAKRNIAGLIPPRLTQIVETTMIWGGTSTGSANAQIIAPEFTADLKGHPTYVFVAGYTNTGAATLSADAGMTNTSLRKQDGTALIGGEIVAGAAYTVVFDGTYWRLISGSGGKSSVTLDPVTLGGTATLVNNLMTLLAFSDVSVARSTKAIPSGKYVFGIRVVRSVSQLGIGICTSAATNTNYLGVDAYGYGYDKTGTKANGGAGSVVSYGSSFGTGDVIYAYVDTVAGKLWFAKNGVLQASGDPAAGTNPAFSGISGTFYAAAYAGSTNGTLDFLVSPSDFPYPIVSGYSTIT